MILPSIKTLETVFQHNAKEARRVLEMNRTQLEERFNSDGLNVGYYNPPSKKDMRLLILNKLAETFGVEAIALGNGEIVEYLNTGDTYTPTLLFWRERYHVLDWGTLVERHGSMDLQEAIFRTL